MQFQTDDSDVVEVSHPAAPSDIVLVCEHASFRIPASLDNLGLGPDARRSHIAWDPGALGVARKMAELLDAVLVTSTVSRLVYDCNRPPEAHDAMPARSEAFDIPGNADLTEDAKKDRVARFYIPFKTALAAEIAKRKAPVIVTIHSFTPVYHGKPRAVEIGILHDADSRLADALLATAEGFDLRRNAPYGPEDGVTHTLKEHALKAGHPNVMIEIRNDLIADAAAQHAMAATLAQWITRALATIGAAQCKA